MPELIEVLHPNVIAWWTVLFVLILPILGLFGTALDYWDWNWFGMGMFLGAFTAIILTFGLAMHQNSANDDATERALEKAGFQEAQYSGGDFDAVWDGERVKGVLLWNAKEGDTTTYQVVIIPPVTK